MNPDPSSDFGNVINAAQNFRDVTNGNKIPYAPLGGSVSGLNSNSYTGTFIQSLGFQRPTPDLSAPGFQNGRVSPTLSHTAFPTSTGSTGFSTSQLPRSNK